MREADCLNGPLSDNLPRAALHLGIWSALPILMLFVLYSGTGSARGQKINVAPDAFEVATIKPARPDATTSNLNLNDGRLVVQNMSLESLLKRAYGFSTGSENQIVGLPMWAKQLKWDISAVESEATRNAMDHASLSGRLQIIRPLLVGLIADRFQLRSRLETKSVKVLALVQDRGGVKLHAAGGCSDQPENCRPDEWLGLHNDGQGNLEARGVDLATLADALTTQKEFRGEQVVDLSDLHGKYDYTLHWRPEDMTGSDDSRPDILVALREQLGLKIIRKVMPLQVLIVDAMSQPTAN